MAITIADAEADGLIRTTERGWNRHDCRPLWLLVADDPGGHMMWFVEEDGSVISDLSDHVLVFRSYEEARRKATDKQLLLNLNDYLRWGIEATNIEDLEFAASRRTLERLYDLP